MSQSRLYVSTPLGDGEPLTLGREQAHYLGRVLRKRVGDSVVVFDGSGREFSGVIASFSKNDAVLELATGVTRDVESPLTLRLLQSVCKGERMDFIVQKATELGVSEIQPILTERTVVRLDGERAGRRTEHWQRVAISACEQSGRNRVPRIHDAIPLTELLAQPPRTGHRLVLSPSAGAGLLAQSAAENCELELLIGPEGGLDDSELSAAVDAGFLAARFGPRILRTETAAIAAIAALQSAWGDLNEP